VVPSPAQPAAAEQLFWFRCYAAFVRGVFEGALLHFGFRAAKQGPEVRPGNQLIFVYKLEYLDGTWEFSASAQH
jgi:hypothetical protein